MAQTIDSDLMQMNQYEETLTSVIRMDSGDEILKPDQGTTLTLNQQTKEISGKVSGETGQSLAGVTVFIKGTTTGTLTDDGGNFKLTLPAGAETVVFSFVGMKTIEEPIGGRTVINVVMSSDEVGLDEIVVIGYGEQKKVNLTGSVATVQQEDLVRVPSSSVSEILTGKAPGLIIKQNSGVVSRDQVGISIRGFDPPLVLVDGIETSWNRLDPNEIESISVLKDAAAAVYGARAGNGVVLITSKRGSGTQPVIKYNSNFTFQQPTTIPELLPAWKYVELLREGQFNSGLPQTYSEEEVQIFKDGTNPDYVSQDWYDAIFVNWAPMQSHNLEAMGGSEKIKFYMSIGYLDQASTFKSGDMGFNRYNARSNVDAQITDRLLVSIDLSFRNEDRYEPESAFQGGDPLYTVWTDLKWAQPVWPAQLPDPQKGGAYAGFTTRSPLAQTYSSITGFRNDKQQFFSGKINLTYKIPGIKGLEASATLNHSTDNRYIKMQDKPFEVFSYDYQNETYASWGINGENSLKESLTKYTQFYPMVALKYNNIIGNHSIQGLLLAEGISGNSFNLSAGRINLLSLEIPYLFAGSPDNLTNNGSAQETGRFSYVGRANYIFKDKYLFEGTFRFDASHKFPKESRWGFFPSLSAAWRISEESFIKDNLPWIENLKIRASISKSGNDNVEAFKYLTGYQIQTAPTSVYVFGQDVYRLVETTGLPNSNITWLEMTNYNVGLDGRSRNGLIGFELDLFYRMTENIFGKPLASYPSTFGATLPELNLNSKDDRGFELTLTHRNKIGKEFEYRVSGSVSLAREKYKRWSESPYDDPDEIRIYQLTGNYSNRWIGYKTDGLFMSQEEIDNHSINQDQTGNTTLRPGDIKYIDLNDDEIIDWRDQDVIGYGTFPDLTYGMDFQLDYRGLSVAALFQGASMFNIYIDDQYQMSLYNWGSPFEFHYQYRWQPDPNNPGVNINPDAQLPAILGDGTGINSHNKKISDFWLKDGTYLRLKNLNVTYTIPSKWTQKVRIQNLSLFVAGSNLFTISKLGIYKKSQDPEESVNLKHFPPMKTISLGVNVTL